MYTFITFVTTPCEKVASGETISVQNPNSFFNRKETVIAKIERRALTAQQAEAQALAKSDFKVRDSFGAVIEDAELNFTTIRKFAIEVSK